MTDQAAALRTIEELERIHGYKIDAILPDGTHRYYSTHCRHGRHADCSATSWPIVMTWEGRPLGDDVRVEGRKPARCKTCAAPCVCPCHRAGDPAP